MGFNFATRKNNLDTPELDFLMLGTKSCQKLGQIHSSALYSAFGKICFYKSSNIPQTILTTHS